VTDDRYQLAVAARFYAKNAESVLRVMKGDALNHTG
jgi:hypothetical protein